MACSDWKEIFAATCAVVFRVIMKDNSFTLSDTATKLYKEERFDEFTVSTLSTRSSLQTTKHSVSKSDQGPDVTEAFSLSINAIPGFLL